MSLNKKQLIEHYTNSIRNSTLIGTQKALHTILVYFEVQYVRFLCDLNELDRKYGFAKVSSCDICDKEQR